MEHQQQIRQLKPADVARSPDPDKLVADAIDSIRKHPLSTLFGTTFHDAEGRVIHRTQGAGIREDGDQEAIHVQISRHEQIRRELAAFGAIEAGRRYIADRHHISDDTLIALLRHSPFVPEDLIYTFARGLTRFFQGDFTSALYILTPLLENSLRHVLKQNGHDVTTFDDARQTQENRSITALYDRMRAELDDICGLAITGDIERVFTITASACIWASLSRRRRPAPARFLRPSGPSALKRCAQSRSVWRSMPPTLVASAWLIPS